jgi:hypothetical protein
MMPITVVTGAEDIELSVRLRDQLRGREPPCVLLVEGDGVPDDACAALAAAGISSVVHAGPARATSLVETLKRGLPRVVLAGPSADVTIDDCEANGWLPATGEVYTPEELAAVTARLQELGYA